MSVSQFWANVFSNYAKSASIDTLISNVGTAAPAAAAAVPAAAAPTEAKEEKKEEKKEEEEEEEECDFGLDLFG